MGYLDNSSITIDAILTRKGRELLARGDFNITQFALSDDEIDYTLWNEDHPNGSAYFGEAIENMPIIEAFPDETQIMKHKLITLPRGTTKLPIISIPASIELYVGQNFTIQPKTFNFVGLNDQSESSGYIFTINDRRLVSLFTGLGVSGTQSTRVAYSNAALSQSVIGTSLNVRAIESTSLFGTATALRTSLTVEGRDSGARITVPFIVTKNTITNASSNAQVLEP